MKSVLIYLLSILLLFNLSIQHLSASKGYAGGIIGINYSGMHLWSENEERSTFDWDSIFPLTLGFEYSYDFVMINYQASLNLERHMGDIVFSNNNFVFRNNLTYQGNYAITRSDGYPEGPGWNDEYTDKMVNASSLQYTGELGYMFTYNFLIFKKVSYKMLFLHNEFQEPGLGVGLLSSLLYDYSTLKGNEILIPEGERAYYTQCAKYKGDEITTIGFQITPVVSYMFDDIFYTAIGVSIMPYPYRSGKVITEDKKIDAITDHEKAVNFFITAGIRVENIIISGIWSDNQYKRYKLPKEGNVELSETVGDFEIRTGIMF